MEEEGAKARQEEPAAALEDDETLSAQLNQADPFDRHCDRHSPKPIGSLFHLVHYFFLLSPLGAF